MKHKDHYLGPVLIGGVVAGILSAIPFVNYCNFIFCMWMLLGAGLAVYLVQQKVKVTIEPGEGAAIGGLTGLVTGALFGVLYILMFLIFGAAMIPGAADGHVAEAGASVGMMALIFGGGCFASLIIYGAFGALGGVIGASIFKQQPPPSGGGGQQFGAPPAQGGGQGFGQPPQGPGGFGQPPQGPSGFGQPPQSGGGFGQTPQGGGGFGQPPQGGQGGPPPGF